MEYEDKMKGHMMCPMCIGIAMGMTRVRIASTPDGGAIVSVNGRLMKYDGELNLVKQIDLALDVEQMHRQMMEMMDSPMHEKMKEKMKNMMMQQGEEQGREGPRESPGHQHRRHHD